MKRAIDIFFSLIGLIFLSPILFLIAILVRIKLGNPVIFSQPRPGLHSKIFNMYKFRTMLSTTDSSGNLLPDAQRLTPFGKTLRSYSLDELPELWNVLMGNMSLVGPRPLLVEYLDFYTPEQLRRHDVKPGITGWAQINGRNALSWNEKFELDIWYVENKNVFLDIKIIFLTIKKVFFKEDINAAGEATMPKYTGKSGE